MGLRTTPEKYTVDSEMLQTKPKSKPPRIQVPQLATGRRKPPRTIPIFGEIDDVMQPLEPATNKTLETPVI